MDVVYILGKGSKANNLEILYSVRSLYQNMLDLGDIYIVGENPHNLPGAIHMYAEDRHRDPWRNAHDKIQEACRIPDLSDDFLLMNDDFFITEQMLGEQWPFFSIKNADGGPAGPLSFAVHAPIRLNKDWYLGMPDLTPMPKHFSPRSFYCNFYGAPPEPVKDFVIRPDTDEVEIGQKIAGLPCFSISNSALLQDSFLSFLEAKYPQPSPLEIDPDQ